MVARFFPKSFILMILVLFKLKFMIQAVLILLTCLNATRLIWCVVSTDYTHMYIELYMISVYSNLEFFRFLLHNVTL